MQLPHNYLQKGKNALHGLQGLVIFLGWALTIAVLVKSGPSDGRTKYFFALCWLSIPVLIYLAAIPAFQRTKRFYNPYASTALDVLFTILWFAAFIGVAVYTNSGISQGEANDKDHKKKGCAAFEGGSESKCKLSQTTIGMGVVIFFLFLATAAISVYSLIHYRRHGSLPGATGPDPMPIADQTKYAFSSNPHDDFDEEEALGGGPRGDRGGETDYELLHGAAEHDDTAYHGGQQPYEHHPGDQIHPHPDPFRGGRTPSPDLYGTHSSTADTSYHGAAGAGTSGGAYRPPAVELQTGAGDPFRDDLALSHDHGGHGGGRRVDFPQGEYGR